jgi:hypothetical protein
VYEKKGRINMRIKRKEKYKMFNPRFKEECIKMVILPFLLFSADIGARV